jgi:hypothetical protein
MVGERGVAAHIVPLPLDFFGGKKIGSEFLNTVFFTMTS